MRAPPEGIDTPARAPLFDPAALRPLHNLNRRLFLVLIDEWRRGRDVTPDLAVLGAKLAPLNDELLWRLARVPICWVDAEFLNVEAWSVAALSTRAGHAPSASPLPRGRALEMAALTFALASTTAKASPEAACIMFGMRQEVAEAFAGFTVETVHRLGLTRAHWVRPRWYESPEDWQRMIATAEHADAARLPPVSLRVLNRMLVDLEPAT
ncbi:MAG: hypothetical protein ACJ8R9_16590 [Steroidobacteraceae bacterium]